jgi:hypothetical protein
MKSAVEGADRGEDLLLSPSFESAGRSITEAHANLFRPVSDTPLLAVAID